MRRANEWILTRLGAKGMTLIKLVIWAGLVTWMICYLAMGIAVAKWFGTNGPLYFGTDIWGIALSFLTPIWIIFTILLTDVLIAKYAHKRLKRD